jgi:hypothetical protein
MLFPLGNASSDAWTTASALPAALPLSDGTLQPAHVLAGLTHTYMDFAGKRAMEAVYAAGSWNFQQKPLGGISFYAGGPSDHAQALAGAKEATFAYSVYFQPGFDFVMGGKLPGLCASPCVARRGPS